MRILIIPILWIIGCSNIHAQPSVPSYAWYIVPAICILLALRFLYSRLRRRHVRMLQQRVAERTRELEDTLGILKASEQQLRKQGLMQQRLLTAITHDIKAPMKYLMLLSANTDRSDEKFMAMHDTLYRMYHLMENLLQYMKMQGIEGYPAGQAVDLYELLEEKTGIFRPIAATRGVEIHNNADRHIRIHGNGQLLAVVVHNLLDNAVKCTPAGSVHLFARQMPGAVHIEIVDTGTGMDPALLAWINAQQEGDGDNHFNPNGIGLMIVIELLQQMNGRLTVSRNGAQGTRMLIGLQPD